MADDKNVSPNSIDSENENGGGNEGMNNEFLVSVFKTGNPAIIAVVKSILDEAGIRFMAKGDNLQNLFGMGSLGTGYNILTGPVDFQVMPEDEAYAKELLKDVDEDSDWYDENSPDDSGEDTPEGDKPADGNA